MSVLLDIDMPISCRKCKLFINCDACEGWEARCAVLGEIGYEEDVPKDHRRPDCPLSEEVEIKSCHTVVTAGTCMLCRKPLEDGTLFLCKDCQERLELT